MVSHSELLSRIFQPLVLLALWVKDVEKLYGSMSSLFGTVRSPQSLDQVLSEANQNLTRTARNIAATLKLGGQIFNEK